MFKKGDKVECLITVPCQFTKGKVYTVEDYIISGLWASSIFVEKDDSGFLGILDASNFRLASSSVTNPSPPTPSSPAPYIAPSPVAPAQTIKFKVGDKVKCVRLSFCALSPPQVVGQEYEVSAVNGNGLNDVIGLVGHQNLAFDRDFDLVTTAAQNSLSSGIVTPRKGYQPVAAWDPGQEVPGVIKYTPSRCECGAEKCNQPGHSSWCPRFAA